MKNGITYILGIVGTGLSAVGTVTQTNEVLQTISLVITIVGGFVSLILIPLLNWFIKAKKDGKITAKEIKEGAETLTDGLEKFNETLPKDKKEK